MTALFALPRTRFKWILVAHTVAMFSLVTLYTATSFNIQSLSYVDIRESSGLDYALGVGPLYTYLVFTDGEPTDLVPTVTFVLNGWFADGLLVSPACNAFFVHLT